VALNQAAVLAETGELRAAEGLFRDVAEQLRRCGNPHHLVAALVGLTAAVHLQGRYEEASAIGRETLTRALEVADRRSALRALTWLGLNALAHEGVAEARVHLEEATAQLSRWGDPHTETLLRHATAQLYHANGDVQRARDELARADRLFADLGAIDGCWLHRQLEAVRTLLDGD